MKNTTLCYLEREGCWLMLHRVKKERDMNRDKWLGVGGKLEENESPEEGIRREVLEETGLTLGSLRYRGLVTFVSDRWEGEYMHLFTSDDFTGELVECDEGDLEWVPIAQAPDLPVWEGDRIFFRLLQTRERFFSLKLTYEGDKLAAASLDGKPIKKG